MASVLRSRGAARVGVGAGGADRAVVLDDEAQEAIVSDLERAAIRSSRTWRAVFGATSVLAGAWFACSGVRAATARDATEAYVGIVHVEFFDAPVPVLDPPALALLDFLTAFALIVSGVAAAFPVSRARNPPSASRGGSRGGARPNTAADVVAPNVVASVSPRRARAFAAGALAGALAAVGWLAAMLRAPVWPRAVAWLPFAALFASPACRLAFASLEKTAADAAGLRALMYDCKTA